MKSSKKQRSATDGESKAAASAENKADALHYMKSLVDVARESFLILDSELRVIDANPVFYENFKVTKNETEEVLLYKLGNGQWDVPELKKMLEEILPEKKVIRDFEVTHSFEAIGERTMLLNARQIDSVKLIILAIEDITTRKMLETKLATTVKDLARRVETRTDELTCRVKELEALNNSMIGREMKMVELKQTIIDLERRLARFEGTNGKNGSTNTKKE